MKLFFLSILSLCLLVQACTAEPDFTHLANLALAVQTKKDVYYDHIDTHQSAATLTADRVELNSLCQQLRDELEPFKPGNGSDGPDFNYLCTVALVLQAEKDFLYQDIDTNQSTEEVSIARSDLDYWCQDMLEDLQCFE